MSFSSVYSEAIYATSFTFKSLNVRIISLPGSFNRFIYENTWNIKMINDYIRLLKKKRHRDGCEANLIKVILSITQLETTTTAMRGFSKTIKSVFLRHLS